jgi:hypothetical protein
MEEMEAMVEMIGATEDRTSDRAIPARVRAAVIRIEGREEMMEGPEMQQWNKGPRLKGGAMSEE